jgi:hypothetical protein
MPSASPKQMPMARPMRRHCGRTPAKKKYNATQA